MPDGSPQVTVVWIDIEGDRILFNTAEGRVKPHNLRRDPRVAISIVDSNNPYAAAWVRGRAVEITADGADAHIDKLSRKYLGRDTYPNRRAGETRLIVVIEPDHVSSMMG
jgi:PPOX class probable F420-dependent enzyme